MSALGVECTVCSKLYFILVIWLYFALHSLHFWVRLTFRAESMAYGHYVGTIGYIAAYRFIRVIYQNVKID